MRVIPFEIDKPSKVINAVIGSLKERNLEHLEMSHQVNTGVFTLISLIGAFTSIKELEGLTVQITPSCTILVSCLLQKLLDTLVLTRQDIENSKPSQENTNVNIGQLLEHLADIMKEECYPSKVYFRQCNACVLMLEIAEKLEKLEYEVQPSFEDQPQPLYGKEVFLIFSQFPWKANPDLYTADILTEDQTRNSKICKQKLQVQLSFAWKRVAILLF